MIERGFQELAALRRRIARLADPSFRQLMVERLSWEARRQIDVGFSRSVDPYDAPWEPLQYRSGRPLDDKGNLRRVLTGPVYRLTPQGFVISTRGARGIASVRYAGTHYRGRMIFARRRGFMRFRVGGTSRTNGRWVTARRVFVPRRPFLPSGRLGVRWTRAFDRVAREVVRGALWRAA